MTLTFAQANQTLSCAELFYAVHFSVCSPSSAGKKSVKFYRKNPKILDIQKNLL